MYYVFYQNNTVGFFDKDMPEVLIIEADSPEEADRIAVDNGVYFDDNYEIDCECCGTRWDHASEWGAKETIDDGLNMLIKQGAKLIQKS